MKLSEYLKQYCTEKGIPISEFEKKCGLSNGWLAKINKLTDPSYEKIKSAYPDIDLDSIRESCNNPNVKDNSSFVYGTNKGIDLKRENELLKESISILRETNDKLQAIIDAQSHIIDLYSKGKM